MSSAVVHGLGWFVVLLLVGGVILTVTGLI